MIAILRLNFGFNSSLKPSPGAGIPGANKVIFRSESNLPDHVIFFELVAYEKFMNAKVKVTVDFGDPRNPRSKNYLLDESCQPKEFNSIVDSINYMTQRGWEFVQAYVVTSEYTTPTAHYLFRKKTE